MDYASFDLGHQGIHNEKLVTLITRLNATVDNGRKPFPKCRRYLVVLSLRFCG